jgi:hypothetical protein
MKNSILICLALFVTITISGCLKKGDDDPLISLRSRKGRVDGKWKVASAKYTITYTSSNNPTYNYSYVFTSNGNTYTLVSTENGVSTSESGTETQEWEFDRDGSYELSIVIDGTQSTSKGRWNFSSGVGDTKNKSQIILSQETSTDTDGQSTYTGNNIDGVYDIKELRNKKMVLYTQFTQKDANGFSDAEYEVELEEN